VGGKECRVGGGDGVVKGGGGRLRGGRGIGRGGVTRVCRATFYFIFCCCEFVGGVGMGESTYHYDIVLLVARGDGDRDCVGPIGFA
jgi:hypothetical protein